MNVRIWIDATNRLVIPWRRSGASFGIALCLLQALLCSESTMAEVFLPGTQPEEGGIRLSKVNLCKTCHSNTDNGESDPYRSWRSGMMSQSSRDPVYRAALAIANQDLEGSGEFCIRCHSPSGWLEGRSKTPDASGLTEDDIRSGVSCDACHRLVDPASEEAKTMVKDVPPGYSSAMMVVDPNKVARGPYKDSPEVKSHKAVFSEFHGSGSLCGTCHDVSNPLASKDVKTQPPHEYGIIERTYSEWLLSDYSKGEGKRTCQSCHYPAVEGGGKAARLPESPHRDHFVQHGPVGGSTWVQDAVIDLWRLDEEEKSALKWGQKKAIEFLQTAAKIEIKLEAGGGARVRVTNLAGHKLPTGYIEGRRAWMNVRFLGSDGKVIRELGRFDKVKSEIFGEAVEVPDLIDPESTHVYECLPGLSEDQAAKYGKKPGKSFHFVLNDIITKDSRIPPKGFSNAAFKERGAQPVGVEYADGQHWDEMVLDLPDGCTKVEARLLYQSVTWEYVKFLAENNTTDDWGKRLYEVWSRTGQCAPSVLAGAVGTVN